MNAASLWTALGIACLLQAALIFWAFGFPGSRLHRSALAEGYDLCGRVMGRFQMAAVLLLVCGVIGLICGIRAW